MLAWDQSTAYFTAMDVHLTTVDFNSGRSSIPTCGSRTVSFRRQSEHVCEKNRENEFCKYKIICTHVVILRLILVEKRSLIILVIIMRTYTYFMTDISVNFKTGFQPGK